MAYTFEELKSMFSSSNRYCSQCGRNMVGRLGGFNKDIFVWECSKPFWASEKFHDHMGYLPVKPIAYYDVKTGEKL